MEYDDLGNLKKQFQEHDGAKDGSTLFTQYTYDTTADTGVFTKAHRLTQVTYPNARLLHHTYGSSGSINDKLSRIAALSKDSTGTPGTPGDPITSYAFNHGGTFVTKTFPTPAGTYTADTHRLDYFGGTSATYSGFDRFGRVIDHRWIDYADPANNNSFADRDAFRHQHDYDRASNKKYTNDTVYKSHSRVFVHDNLHRLKSFKEGRIDSANSDIMAIWTTRATSWTLDQLGNQLSDASNTYEVTNHTINKANEYATHSVKANTNGKITMGKGGSYATADFTLPAGSGDTFVATTGYDYVEFTALSQDTYDSHQEEEARGYVLFGEAIGTNRPLAKIYFPIGATTGQAGIVFGYKNPNRARVWSPTLGRFIQRDPLGYPDGLNAYGGYHVLSGGLDPSGLIPMPWINLYNTNALSQQGAALGIGNGFVAELAAVDDTNYYVGGPGDATYTDSILYQNTITLPGNFFERKGAMGRVIRKDLDSVQLGIAYNELWQAWWDQVLEEDCKCKWLYDHIKHLARREYSHALYDAKLNRREVNDQYLEMMNEAASETIQVIAGLMGNQNLSRRLGRPILPIHVIKYENAAMPPGHHEHPDDEWYKPRYRDFAGKTMSMDAFNAVLYAMRNGCASPSHIQDVSKYQRGNKPDIGAYIKNKLVEDGYIQK